MSKKQLALYGGRPAKERPIEPIFPGGLEIGEEEEQAVLEVLRGKGLFRYYAPYDTPSKVAEFEDDFKEKMGGKYVLAVNSGTSAVHTAFVAAGVGPGDEVIVPAYDFIATAVAVVAARAIPVIAEIDESLTLDPADVEAKITRHTKAIAPVHMRGVPSDMEAIMSIARDHDLRVIEDVAQATGGSYRGQRLGTLGDVGAYSLQYHKIVTAGEGGVVMTDDPYIYDRARMFHDTAGDWRKLGYASEGEGIPFVPGLNYRMSELIGAVALVQLRRLDGLLERMRASKRRILEGIKDLQSITLARAHDPEGDTGTCVHFFTEEGETAKSVSQALRAENIRAHTWYDKGIPDWHVYAHWDHLLNKVTVTPEGCPFTCQFYKGKVEYSREMCPRSLDLLSRLVEVMVDPRWTDKDVAQTVDGVRKVVNILL